MQHTVRTSAAVAATEERLLRIDFNLPNSCVDDNTNADGKVDLLCARQRLGEGPRGSVTAPNCAVLGLHMLCRMDPGAGRFWPHVPGGYASSGFLATSLLYGPTRCAGYESDDDNGHDDSEDGVSLVSVRIIAAFIWYCVVRSHQWKFSVASLHPPCSAASSYYSRRSQLDLAYNTPALQHPSH